MHTSFIDDLSLNLYSDFYINTLESDISYIPNNSEIAAIENLILNDTDLIALEAVKVKDNVNKFKELCKRIINIAARVFNSAEQALKVLFIKIQTAITKKMIKRDIELPTKDAKIITSIDEMKKFIERKEKEIYVLMGKHDENISLDKSNARDFSDKITKEVENFENSFENISNNETETISSNFLKESISKVSNFVKFSNNILKNFEKESKKYLKKMEYSATILDGATDEKGNKYNVEIISSNEKNENEENDVENYDPHILQLGVEILITSFKKLIQKCMDWVQKSLVIIRKAATRVLFNDAKEKRREKNNKKSTQDNKNEEKDDSSNNKTNEPSEKKEPPKNNNQSSIKLLT